MKSQVLHTVWGNISGEAAGEIWDWSLLGRAHLPLSTDDQVLHCSTAGPGTWSATYPVPSQRCPLLGAPPGFSCRSHYRLRRVSTAFAFRTAPTMGFQAGDDEKPRKRTSPEVGRTEESKAWKSSVHSSEENREKQINYRFFFCQSLHSMREIHEEVEKLKSIREWQYSNLS